MIKFNPLMLLNVSTHATEWALASLVSFLVLNL